MYVKHGADTTDAWLRQPNQVKSAILKGSVIFWMTALRESIAETLSTSTICLSEAKAVVAVRKSWASLVLQD